MGKQRRVRQKLHTSLNTTKQIEPPSNDLNVSNTNLNNTWPLVATNTNIFANVNIDFDALKKDLNDDVKSVKSVKPLKSNDNATGKIIKKKDKLKIRKQLLLRKIDTVNQLKKELKLKKKNKIDIIGDVKSLADSLPSLDYLVSDNKKIQNTSGKVKGIPSAYKRKKEMSNNVKNFKKIIDLDIFKKNPFVAVQNHIDKFVNVNNL